MQTKPRLPPALSLLVAGIILAAGGFAVSGCGGDDPEPQPNDAGYPFDEARTGADGYAKVPGLTARQKAEVTAIAKADPELREILEGRSQKWGAVAPWTRGNQELLGGVIEIALGSAVDFPATDWPTVENTEELYGKQGPEGQLLVEDLEPRVEPEVGVRRSSEEGVRSLVVMVDLEEGQVAAVMPMPTVGI